MNKLIIENDACCLLTTLVLSHVVFSYLIFLQTDKLENNCYT